MYGRRYQYPRKPLERTVKRKSVSRSRRSGSRPWKAEPNPSAFHDALDFYNYVKTAARQRVPGAEPVYALLKPYFKRSRTGAAEDKPTEKQIERDVRGLLSGTKEGRITIENENPDASGGRRHVLDEVHPADAHTGVHTDYRTQETPE